MIVEVKPANRRLLWASIPIFIVGIAFIGYQIANKPNLIPLRDFVEYYSAGVVNLQHGNPYDSQQLLPIQQQALDDPDLDEAMMMWNPPWMLPLVTPLGFFSAKVAHLIWLSIQFFSMLASCLMLWRVYDGPTDRWIIGIIAGLFFGPFFVLMWYGQVGTLCLLGLAGYLYFLKRDVPALAGLFVALTAIKPHLLFAFGLVLVLDGLFTRRGRIVLIFGAMALLVAAGIAWLLNPDSFHYYRMAGWTNSQQTHTSPKDWKLPLISYWLRRAISPDHFFIQFIPTIIASIATAWYWFYMRTTWNWLRETPYLIFISVIFSAYGAWIFDLVVLMVPVVQAAVWLTQSEKSWKPIIAIHVLLNAFVIVVPIAILSSGMGSMSMKWFIFFSPATLLLFLWAKKSTTKNESHVNLP